MSLQFGALRAAVGANCGRPMAARGVHLKLKPDELLENAAIEVRVSVFPSSYSANTAKRWTAITWPPVFTETVSRCSRDTH